MEVWKDVPGYEGYYQVSNLGRIKSKKRGKENILKGSLNTKGYVKIKLYLHGSYKSVSVHRLVSFNFIPNHKNKPDVNHINGIKTDNRVENLEWCTHSENMRHAKENGLIKKGSESGMYGIKGYKHPRYGKTGNLNGKSRKVIDNSTGIIYESLKDASMVTKYSTRYLSDMLLGRYKNKTSFEYLTNK